MGLSEQNIAEKFRNHVQQRYSTIYDGAMTFVHLHSKIAEDGSVISPISNTSIGESASTNSQATKSICLLRYFYLMNLYFSIISQ